MKATQLKLLALAAAAISLAVLLIRGVASPAGCEETIFLTGRDNGREIVVGLGGTVRIELKRSGGTGYEWHLEDSYKETFELLSEETEETGRDGIVGAPGIRWWLFRAIREGEADIELLLYRAWEGKQKSAESYKIRAKVIRP